MTHPPRGRDRRRRHLRHRRGHQAAGSRRRRRRHPREGRDLRRHLAREHLPRLRVRRPVQPLLLLLRAQQRLVARLRQPAGDPRLRRRRRPRPRPRADHPVRRRGARRGMGRRRRPVDASTLRRATLTARFLVAAAGPWNEPQIPDLPGLADFPGEVWHSAQWNHDFDLDGKRVAVVGTGASAVQFVPDDPEAGLRAAPVPAHRALGAAQGRPPRARRREVGQAPRPVASSGRSAPSSTPPWRASASAFQPPQPLMHGLQKVGQAYLRAAVRDKELRAKLTPDYLLGCKRILFSNNYLQSLTKPNVEVHATGVDRVEGSTVRRRRRQHGGGRRDHPRHRLPHPRHAGRRLRPRRATGARLAEHWAGSPEAYHGTVVAGFPNAFVVLGPSLGTGHASAFTVAEAQVAMIVDADHDGPRAGLDVARRQRPEAQAAYVDEVQAALVGTAYSAASCHSYFIDANGRNSFSWPWSTGELVRRVSRFDRHRLRDRRRARARRGHCMSRYPKIDLDGALVVVTGAARGIGLATAKAFVGGRCAGRARRPRRGARQGGRCRSSAQRPAGTGSTSPTRRRSPPSSRPPRAARSPGRRPRQQRRCHAQRRRSSTRRTGSTGSPWTSTSTASSTACGWCCPA